MTNKDFYTLYAEAVGSDDREAFVVDYATSSIFGTQEAQSDDDLLANAQLCGETWDVAHMTVKELCKAVGMTQAALSYRFCVPYRTVQDWYSGRRSCPPYITLAMAELLGVIKVPRS